MVPWALGGGPLELVGSQMELLAVERGTDLVLVDEEIGAVVES